MRTLINIEVGITAAGFLAFIVLYQRTRWWRQPEGRHLMFTTASLALITGLWFVGRLVGGLPLQLWAAVLAPLAVAAWWRVVLLWRRQHEGAVQPFTLKSESEKDRD